MVLKRLAILFIVGLFAMLSVAPLFTQQVSAATPTDLDGQIKSYKLYNTLDNCFADRIKVLDSISASEIASWDIFNGQIGAGAIVSGGKGDGNVDCKQQMADAASLWGITDPVAFLKKAGWDIYTVTQSDYTACSIGSAGAGGVAINTCPLPGKYYKKPTSDPGGKFQNAAKSYIDNKAPTYAAYFPYEDALKTLSICGVTVTSGAPNETAKAQGSKSIWLVGKDGTPTEATASTTNASSMYFGPASSPFSHDTKCSEVVSYLSDKNNAVKFYGSLPGALKTAWTGADVGAAASGNTTDGKSSCAVEGIGWVLCPVINAMAGMADASFGLVAAFMEVKPLGFDQSNPLYSAWSTMRNIANVAFVITFLIIIFSQLTGAGISNYGVKKMLPRIIIAAILVNLSYFICAIAVDLSNIIGVSIQHILSNMANGIVGENGEDLTKMWGSIAISVLSLGAIGGGAIAIASAVSSIGIWGMLAGLLPLLVSALLALIIAFLVLIARQAFIIILIVISPLAFVAFLLPNTEDLFKKWRGFFTTLLALFPMMALVFGGSVLASAIMRQGATGLMDTGDAAQKTTGFFIYLGGVAVLAIPFFITPVLIKLSGGLLNRFAGFINNPNKGPFDRMRKGAERVQKNAQNRGYLNKLNGGGRVMNFGARRRARIDAIGSGLESEAKRGAASYVAKEIQDKPGFARAVAGGRSADSEAITRAAANAINITAKLEADEVNAAKAVIEHANLSGAQRQQLATQGSITHNGKTYGGETFQRAAIQEQMKTGSMDQIHDLVSKSGSSLSAFKQTIAQGVATNGVAAKDPSLGGKAIDDISQGLVSGQQGLDRLRLEAAKKGKFTAEALIGMDNGARTALYNTALASTDQAARNAIRDTAVTIQGDPELSAKIAGNTSAQGDIGAMRSL